MLSTPRLTSVRHTAAIFAWFGISLLGLARPTAVLAQDSSVISPSSEAAATVDSESTTIAPAEQLFVRRILPIMRQRCWACHGDEPDDLRGDLDMRSREALLRGGESDQPALVPGDAASSPIYQAILWDGLEMPPKENDRLNDQQVAQWAEWIDAGAPWPAADRITLIRERYVDRWSAEDGERVSTSGGLSSEWTQRSYDPENLWGYRPLPSHVPVPAPVGQFGAGSSDLDRSHRQPAGSPIDAFIERRLAGADMTAAAPADRATLIRRVTFDLTGLPPTAEEIEAFVSDPRSDADAWAEVVDGLLASPHYGERYARHWLDVVRYADSSGFANDYQRGNAWRYRDYVVRSFNDDKPYDRFVVEQIAGDQLDPDDPEMHVAVGFLRMGPWELTGMEVAKVARQRFLDDVTGIVGETFLAHPLQCARCHDHKFDPVPTRDYYAIQACFATTQLAERHAAFLPRENQSGFERSRYLKTLQRGHQRTLDQLDQLQQQAALEWYADNELDSTAWRKAADRATQNNPRRVFSAARGALRRANVSEDEIPPKGVGFEPKHFGMERVARKGIERLRWELDRFEPYALSVYSGGTPDRTSVYAPVRVPEDPLTSGQVESTHILIGGDPFSLGEQVAPGVLSAASLDPAAAIPEQTEGRRLALAGWIADADNPLTARVIANRIWQWHFGRAIAGNPNNFGATGKKPTHPELLDWLARELVDSGWSIKHLHRVILNSQAYRRSSHANSELTDPDAAQQMYAAFTPRRLSAEELRDAMLSVGGQLNRTLGGIPCKPEINREVAMQPRMVMGTFARAWVPDPLPEQRHRRSLYVLSLRGLRDPAMEVFNQPGPDFSCEAREVSTITPQVFTLLNSEISYRRAIAVALRTLQFPPSANSVDSASRQLENQTDPSYPPEAIDRLFRLVLGRQPDADDRQRCVQHWTAMTERHRDLQFAQTEYPTSIEREAVEENTGERFSFEESLPETVDFVPDSGPADVSPHVRGLAEVALVLLNTNEFLYVY